VLAIPVSLVARFAAAPVSFSIPLTTAE
jgi:hypothetical protein